MGPGLEPLIGLLRCVRRLEMRRKFKPACTVQTVKELAEAC